MSKNSTMIIFGVDGMEYPIDLGNLIGREIGTLKRVGHVAGVVELQKALLAGDLEAVAALVGIAMERSGIKPDYEQLLDLPAGAVEVIDPDKRPTQALETGGTPS